MGDCSTGKVLRVAVFGNVLRAGDFYTGAHHNVAFIAGDYFSQASATFFSAQSVILVLALLAARLCSQLNSGMLIMWALVVCVCRLCLECIFLLNVVWVCAALVIRKVSQARLRPAFHHLSRDDCLHPVALQAQACSEPHVEIEAMFSGCVSRSNSSGALSEI